MDLTDIENRLTELDESFRRVGDDSEDFDEELASAPDMDLYGYLELLEKRATTPYGRLFAEFREFVLSTLLDWYLRGSSEERQAVLGIFQVRRFALIALWSLLSEHRWRLQKAPPQEVPASLRTFLLLAVLAEEYLDHVETAHLLTSAWRRSEACGLDPAPFFEEAAGVAGRRKLTHGESANELLWRFEPYIYGGPTRG